MNMVGSHSGHFCNKNKMRWIVFLIILVLFNPYVAGVVGTEDEKFCAMNEQELKSGGRAYTMYLVPRNDSRCVCTIHHNVQAPEDAQVNIVVNKFRCPEPGTWTLTVAGSRRVQVRYSSSRQTEHYTDAPHNTTCTDKASQNTERYDDLPLRSVSLQSSYSNAAVQRGEEKDFRLTVSFTRKHSDDSPWFNNISWLCLAEQPFPGPIHLQPAFIGTTLGIICGCAVIFLLALALIYLLDKHGKLGFAFKHKVTKDAETMETSMHDMSLPANGADRPTPPARGSLPEPKPLVSRKNNGDFVAHGGRAGAPGIEESLDNVPSEVYLAPREGYEGLGPRPDLVACYDSTVNLKPKARGFRQVVEWVKNENKMRKNASLKSNHTGPPSIDDLGGPATPPRVHANECNTQWTRDGDQQAATSPETPMSAYKLLAFPSDSPLSLKPVASAARARALPDVPPAYDCQLYGAPRLPDQQAPTDDGDDDDEAYDAPTNHSADEGKLNHKAAGSDAGNDGMYENPPTLPRPKPLLRPKPRLQEHQDYEDAEDPEETYAYSRTPKVFDSMKWKLGSRLNPKSNAVN